MKTSEIRKKFFGRRVAQPWKAAKASRQELRARVRLSDKRDAKELVDREVPQSQRIAWIEKRIAQLAAAHASPRRIQRWRRKLALQGGKPEKAPTRALVEKPAVKQASIAIAKLSPMQKRRVVRILAASIGGVVTFGTAQ